jgi:hypothetical protein
MTNEEPPVLAAVLVSLTDFGRSCVPGKFTELLSSSEVLKSIARMIILLEDEDEQETAARAFHGASRHFDFVVHQSYFMHLLEDENGDQTKAAQLARALALPERRGNVLLVLGVLCLAGLCGAALRRNRDSAFFWDTMIAVASDYPAMARLAPSIDPDAFMSKHASTIETAYRRGEAQGLRVIDLHLPLVFQTEYAYALWLELLQDGPDKAMIERIRQLLRRVLHFLQSPPIEPWILQPYKSIQPTDSLRGILDEILNYDLVDLVKSNDSMNSAMKEIYPNTPYQFLLTEGRILKRKYVIVFPGSRYFIGEHDEERFEEFAAHPLQFIKDHLDDIPRSIETKAVEKHVARIEALQNEENLEPWLKSFATVMTANAIALALCNSFQLPSEARAFITAFVSSLILLVRRNPQ